MFWNSDKHQAWEAGTFSLECLSTGVRLPTIKEHSRLLSVDYALWGAVSFPALPHSPPPPHLNLDFGRICRMQCLQYSTGCHDVVVCSLKDCLVECHLSQGSCSISKGPFILVIVKGYLVRAYYVPAS